IMSKAQDFFLANSTPEGRLSWPADPSEQEALARTLFGLGFIEAHDYWVREALGYLPTDSHSKPVQRSERSSQEHWFRTGLASLTAEQASIVSALIRRVAGGVLFSVLVSIDQFQRAEIELALLDDSGSSGRPRRVLIPTGDLHDLLCELLE